MTDVHKNDLGKKSSDELAEVSKEEKKKTLNREYTGGGSEVFKFEPENNPNIVTVEPK